MRAEPEPGPQLASLGAHHPGRWDGPLSRAQSDPGTQSPAEDFGDHNHTKPCPEVLDSILAWAQVDPSSPAARDYWRSLDYRALAQEILLVGKGLVERGLERGDRVALCLPNSIDFLVGALGSNWAGCVFVPMSPQDPAARLRRLIQDCHPRLVVVHPDQGIDEAIMPAGVELTTIAELASRGSRSSARRRSWELAYCIYTSGTTGTPKGIMIPTASFAWAVHWSIRLIGLSRATRSLCVSPFFFDGSFGILFTTAAAGGYLEIPRREAIVVPRVFIRLLEDQAINHSSCSPTYLRHLLSSPISSRLGKTGLATLTVGGEALEAADLEALWQVAPNIKVFNRYGPTETTIAVTTHELGRSILERGEVPVGQPHPGVCFHLLDESGKEVSGPGASGELYIGGRQLMAGYWHAPELTRNLLSNFCFEEPHFRSGDVMRIDKEGNFVFVSRTDRLIKRSGVRISLVELTRILRSAPGVKEGACLAAGPPERPRLVAFVVPEDRFEPVSLRASLAERLPGAMLPDDFVEVEALPTTRTGKLDEARLIDLASQLAYSPGEASQASSKRP